MIKLSKLVAAVNDKYSLNLDETAQSSMVKKMKVASYEDSIDRSEVSGAVDLIIDLSKSSDSKIYYRVAYAAAGGPRLVKTVRTADTGTTCPRCKGQMKSAKLTTNSLVDYCRKCRIALPIN